jgi:superfamily II DNA or RNA helicase
MENKLLNKLLPYQISHIHNLIDIINSNDRALDASDTGTGKTYTSIALCRLLNLKPFIICPKSVVQNWTEVLEYYDYIITNPTNLQNPTNPYELTTYNQILNHRFLITDQTNQNLTQNQNWTSDPILSEYLFIFDEVHKCKNKNTINASVLLNLSNISYTKILLLSATAVDKISNFYVIGYVLKLYLDYEESLIWMNKISYNKSNPLLNIHNAIFPKYASRMSIDHIQDIFKNNQIEMEGIQMPNYFEIEEQYDSMNILMTKAKINKLSQIQKLRQRIEFLKINTFVEITNKYIQNGKSVVIFVNFTHTLLELAKILNTKCIIYGDQTLEERTTNIHNFCIDKSRIIICNIQSGGCGISLHDTKGNFPRVSLISPTWSAQDLIQVLGRIHRAMSKSDAVQRIIFCKDTFEENIGKILKNKINNIKILNNGKKVLKNDSLKNIIEKQFEIKESNNKKKIDLIEDYDKIYNILEQLYISRDKYELDLSQMDKSNVKIKELNYHLKKVIEQINIYENKLQQDI